MFSPKSKNRRTLRYHAIAIGVVSLIYADTLFPNIVFSAPAKPAEPVKAAPANHPVLHQAKRLIDQGQEEEAVTVLRRFLATNPKPDLLDDTYLLLAAALYGSQQYGEALKYLQQLQSEFPNSEVMDRGKLLLARTHAAMGNIDLAYPILTSIRTQPLDEAARRDAMHISGELYLQ